MKQLTLLTKNMHTERMDVLKDNEEHIKKGGVDSDEEDDYDDGNDIGNEDDNGDDEDFEDSDEEWKKQQKLFAKLGPKLHTGKALTKEEMDEFGLDGEDDDDDDSDFEYNCGESSLYDSRIDDIDELKTLKDLIVQINQNNSKFFEDLFKEVDAQ